jgi:CDP-diacylglycerol---serine O-phosphatidyltransferase
LKLKSHIPNAITCLNLLSGMIGIYYVLNHHLQIGAYFIFAAAVFDFLDGFVARILKVQSEIGKQLDSLADLVTFGVLPSFILFQWLKETTSSEYLPFIAFLIGIFSAVRLAKFNIDTRQSDQFIGLPTPANALLISTLPFLTEKFMVMNDIIAQPIALVIIIVLLSYLLVAELPLIALKFKNYQLKDNLSRYSVVLTAIIFILTLGISGIPFVIGTYLLISILEKLLFVKI